MPQFDFSGLVPLIPELFLLTMAIVLLICGLYRGQDSVRQMLRVAAIFLVLTAGLCAGVFMGGQTKIVMSGTYRVDTYSAFVKIVILLASAMVLLITRDFGVGKKSPLPFEYPVFLLLAVCGMMVMVSANDLITLYMGLELQSLALYVMASISRDDSRSSEAGLKYFVLGALASGILLYGCSLIYGFAGSTNFDALAGHFKASGAEFVPSIGLLVGTVLVIIAMCFKISAAPFHMWAPDVYEGAPTPVTAFFAAAPKAAAVALLARVLSQPLGALVHDWQQIVVVISIISMAVGAIGAIKQTNIKRLLAYSSIGHAGYILVGLAAGTKAGVEGALIYIAIYVTMSVGAFACVLLMRRRGEMVENISDLAGLSSSHPIIAAVLTVFMLSMAGIPPLAGFFGKFFVFLAAVQAGLFTLAVIGVILSVIGAFYYLRIIKIIYFDQLSNPLDKHMGMGTRVVLAVTGVFNLLLCLAPTSLFNVAKQAAGALF